MTGIVNQTTQNMAEDLTMMVGYSLVNTYIQKLLTDEFPPEVDENGRERQNIALEVLSGGASFLFMSAMMEVIRREEKYIDYLFAAGEAVISVLWARNKGYFEGMIYKIKSLKGYKAKSKVRQLHENTDNQNTFITQVQQQIQNILHGRNSSHDVANTIQASNSSQDTAINREAHNLKFAKANAEAFHNSFMLKVMSGSFTQADEIILQKIIGRTDFRNVPISIDEMNKVHEFMIVKDSNGKFIGLTEAFTSLVNGLGFINK